MWNRVFAPLVALVLVAAHFWFLFQHCPPTFQSPDANGYFAQAALLANHGRTELQPETPLAYVGLHWLGVVEEGEDGTKTEHFHSRYPPGVGWLLAPFYRLIGPERTMYVTPLLGSLTLLFLFLLCRPHVGPTLSLVAVALYGLQPDANSHALNWGAHTQVAFFLMVGLYLIDSWSRSPTWWRALLGGFCLGFMPTMRPAEVTAGLGVAAFLVYQVARKGEIREHHKRHLLVAILGAAVPIAALLIHNYAAFGNPLDTGYSLTGEQQAGSGFGWAFFEEKWRPFTEMLMSTGAGLFFTLGVLGLFAMLTREKVRGIAMMLIGVVFPVTLTYMAYYWGGGETGLRFLIPMFPLFTLPALWLLREMATDRRILTTAVLALIAFQTVLWLPDTGERLRDDRDRLTRMHDAVVFLDTHLDPGSVVITDRQLAETLQYYPKWTVLDASVVSGGRGGGMFGGRTRGRGGRDPMGGPPGPGRDPAGGPPDPGGVPADGQDDSIANASPMQRDKGKVLRKELNEASTRTRRTLIAAELEKLRKQNTGGVYWLMRSSSGTGSTLSRFMGGSSGSRSSMRRLKFEDGRKFKFVDSVTLSKTTEQVERAEYDTWYEEEYGTRPPRDRRSLLGGLMRGRGPGGGGRGIMDRRRMNDMFGPSPGATYRLYKLAARGEDVAVDLQGKDAESDEESDDTDESPEQERPAAKPVEAGARKEEGAEPADAPAERRGDEPAEKTDEKREEPGGDGGK